jgi:hypothetical protein
MDLYIYLQYVFLEYKHRDNLAFIFIPNNSLLLDIMLRVATAVQQIMTDFKAAVSEKATATAITKNGLKYNESKWLLGFICPSKL